MRMDEANNTAMISSNTKRATFTIYSRYKQSEIAIRISNTEMEIGLNHPFFNTFVVIALFFRRFDMPECLYDVFNLETVAERDG